LSVEESLVFYAFQMDAEGKLANCFWVDSRSKK